MWQPIKNTFRFSKAGAVVVLQHPKRSRFLLRVLLSSAHSKGKALAKCCEVKSTWKGLTQATQMVLLLLPSSEVCSGVLAPEVRADVKRCRAAQLQVPAPLPA